MAVVYILLMVGETIAMIIMNQQFAKVDSVNDGFVEDSALLLARLIQFIIAYIIEKTISFRNSNELSLYHIVLFVLTGGISGYLQVVMCFVLAEQKVLLLITDICILILNFLIVIIYEKPETEIIKNKDNQIIRLKNEAYEHEIQLMLESEANIRLLRHDMKNHCLAIDSYMDNEHHGFGIKSIEKEISSIGGVLDISHDNKWFMAKVVIPL